MSETPDRRRGRPNTLFSKYATGSHAVHNLIAIYTIYIIITFTSGFYQSPTRAPLRSMIIYFSRAPRGKTNIANTAAAAAAATHRGGSERIINSVTRLRRARVIFVKTDFQSKR